MSCQELRQRILDHGWDDVSLRQAAELLRHIEDCEACRRSLKDYDQLRAALELRDDEDVEIGTPAHRDSRPPSFPPSPANLAIPWRRLAIAAALLAAASGWMLVGLQNVRVVRHAPPSIARGDAPPLSRLSQAEIDRHVQIGRASCR